MRWLRKLLGYEPCMHVELTRLDRRTFDYIARHDKPVHGMPIYYYSEVDGMYEVWPLPADGIALFSGRKQR